MAIPRREIQSRLPRTQTFDHPSRAVFSPRADRLGFSAAQAGAAGGPTGASAWGRSPGLPITEIQTAARTAPYTRISFRHPFTIASRVRLSFEKRSETSVSSFVSASRSTNLASSPTCKYFQRPCRAAKLFGNPSR